MENDNNMEIHFLYDDPTKDYHTTSQAVFAGTAPLPPKLGLIVVATVYDPPNQEYGNLLMGWDKYYFNVIGNTLIEYAWWNNGMARTEEVWRTNAQIGGEFIHRTNIRVNTFSTANIWTGALVSDEVYNAIVQRAVDRAW